MFVKAIRLNHYRNITTGQLEPGRYLTILHGNNGQGKTNLLEAIYLLGTARTFRTAKVTDLIQHEATSALVQGTVETAGLTSSISHQLETNGIRRVSVDGKTAHRASDLYGRLAAVVFSPDDTAMVKLGPDIRRRYLDRSLYMSEQVFLQDYHSYYRTLKQRNALLKSGQLAELDLWTEQLAAAGVRLMEHRQRYVTTLNSLLRNKYGILAGEQEQVSLQYRPDCGAEAALDSVTFTALLQQQIDQDLRYKTTGRGPHRDDLIFYIQGRPLKGFGSQGQQRSFVLALKLAEMEYLRQTFGEMPVLLLDDIASELDRKRISNLLQYVREQEVQVIITTTDVAPFTAVLQDDSKRCCIEGGRLTYEGNGKP